MDIRTLLDPTMKGGSELDLTIYQIERDYIFFCDRAGDNEAIQHHAERLSSIRSAAFKLKKLLNKEPLLFHLLEHNPFIDGPPTEADIRRKFALISGDANSDEKEIFRLLHLIVSRSDHLLNDRARLRSLRYDAEAKDASKSLERRAIWTPLMDYCYRYQIRFSFYEKGALFRSLNIIHNALDAPPLKSGSLRRAIEEYAYEPSIFDDEGSRVEVSIDE
ncbi:MAG: hypothetical protein K2X71_18930 [Methylobacterium sp.]|uniref:hypothetical protein n=1 Tax=Methylobacterium sp. TaxID=409 RepID=UPI002586BCDA|nr:hypothetical protein [Methylobacterium sp.]MBY0298076.1 hypothetical protein [Methylobacterium sp.]